MGSRIILFVWGIKLCITLLLHILSLALPWRLYWLEPTAIPLKTCSAGVFSILCIFPKCWEASLLLSFFWPSLSRVENFQLPSIGVNYLGLFKFLQSTEKKMKKAIAQIIQALEQPILMRIHRKRRWGGFIIKKYLLVFRDPCIWQKEKKQ